MIPTPTTVDELLALVAAARPQMPQRLEQFALPLKDRTPGYLRLACVRVVITPSLARQLLARAAADPVVGLAGVVKFGGPASSDAVWSVPEGERKYRIGRVENVVRLARIILAGEWDPNRLSAHALPDAQPVHGEPLSLTRDGIVIHGDHRLHAVDLTDLPIIDDFLAQ
jgi:hypothetical protein